MLYKIKSDLHQTYICLIDRYGERNLTGEMIKKFYLNRGTKAIKLTEAYQELLKYKQGKKLAKRTIDTYVNRGKILTKYLIHL